MIISLASKWIGNLCCYLYPAYASYKALSIHPETSPLAQQQIERWLMYWAVVGTWTAVEAVLGWSFTWLPFYSVFKTFILLYLSLPQSEGSSYIYRTHLAPFFEEHEMDIDAFLASLRSRASTALAGGVGWAWEKAKAQLNVALPATVSQLQGAHPGADNQHQVPGPMHQPPTLSDPASGAAQQVYSYFTRYAGYYMPLAISTLSAAAASASGAARGVVPPAQSQNGRRTASSSEIQGFTVGATQIPNEMEMPIPIPTPSLASYPSDGSLRSRTYLQAQAVLGQGISSARLYPTSIAGHPRSASSPLVPIGRLSPQNSEESITSRSSGSGGQSSTKWVGGVMSGYEEIRREEVEGVPPSGSGTRPELGEKRRSSWFGWGGPYQAIPDHPKDE